MRRLMVIVFAAGVGQAGGAEAQTSSVDDTAPDRSARATTAPAPARAQAVRAPWLLGLGYVYERYREDRTEWRDWHTIAAFARRRLEGGAVVLEVMRARRFGEEDMAVAVDAYADLWRGAYGNLRVQGATGADVLPDVDGAAELFHALGGGWEGSVGVRLMRFRSQDVGFLSAGAGRYLPGWYLRGWASLVRSAGATTSAYTVLARRFLSDPDAFVEIAGGSGDEVVVLGPGPRVDLRRTVTLGARAQVFLTERWGVAGGIGYQDAEAVPGRMAVEVGVRGRW